MTTLRDYQGRAVDAVRAHWAAGTLAVLVVLPTGTGKTETAAALRPALALVHTTTLREQAARRLGAGVRVETIQGVLRAGAPLDLPPGAVVWIDEAHHIAAGAWRTVLALLPAGARIVGTTATPERADGTPLGDVFGAMVNTIGYSGALASGYLSPCSTVAAPRDMDPATAYRTFGQGRPGVIFAPTIAECNAAVAALVRAGVRAAAIDSTTPASAREWAVAAYGRGELDVLASPMALAEGFDAPRAAVAVLGRRCHHVSTYLQIVNRVTRPFPGKTALVVDLTGAVERHGHPLEDREYSLTGRGISRRAPPVARPAARRPVLARAAGAAVGSAIRAVWGMIVSRALRAVAV